MHGRKRYRRSVSLQDAVPRKHLRAWDLCASIEPDWTVHLGDYWKFGDSIWHPTGTRGAVLTGRLKRRLDSQVRWVFDEPDLVRDMLRTGAIEAVLDMAFRDRGDLLHGTVRIVTERVNRLRVA